MQDPERARSLPGPLHRHVRAAKQSVDRGCLRRSRARNSSLSAQDRKSDPREALSHYRLPARVILARPEFRCLRIVKDVTSFRIDRELSPELLRDGPEVTERSGLGPVFDWRG